MNEEQIQAYMQLIQALLACPNGEENAVLQANGELVDQGLVIVMRQYAEYVRQDGQAGAADFLVNMAAQLAEALGMEGMGMDNELENFCKELFQAEMNGGQEAVFAVLAQNLALVNADLGQALIDVSQGILSQNDDPEVPEMIAGLTENICNYLQQFPLGNPRGKLVSAIAGYHYVLSLRTNNPEKTAQTQNNLGSAYSDLAPFSANPKQEIENAIACYRAALIVRTEAKLPQAYAMTQNNLGNAYSDLAPFSANPKQEIENAIACYRAALIVYTEAELPQDFAMTQNNLGNAYSRLAPFSANPKQEIENAIACYRAALIVRTPELRSADCLQTGRNLGNLGFKEGLWKIAIEGYEKAIAAVETTRSWATNDDRRAEILREAMEVYSNAIQSYINLSQYDKAIALTERSRSRHLVELMASNDAYAKGDIPPEVLNYLQQYEALERRLAAERQRQKRDSENKSTSELSPLLAVGLPKAADIYKRTLQTVTELSAEKDRIWLKIRALDQVLAGTLEVQPPDFAAMQALLKDQPKTAIVSFYSTNDNTHIFVLRTTGVTIHTCEKQGYSSLQVYLREQWLKPYAARSPQWQENMEANLTEISQRLELDKLITEHLTDITELIIIPHIYLHLIPFAALPITPISKSEKYLSDRFLLRILPSCQILAFCQARDPIAIATYTTIENATDDLVMAGFECEQIAKICDIPNDRRIQGSRNANRKNVSAKLLDKTNPTHLLHASHHAGSNLDYPLESALQLANQETITLGQLLSPAWRMKELEEVFLSCCETNLTNPNTNDDILTIGTGFLCAGARGVISTLWSVNAFATALFCIFYYEERKGNEAKKGGDRPTAIYNAQKRLREFKGAELGIDQPTGIAIEDYLKQQLETLVEKSSENKKEQDQLSELIENSLSALTSQPFPFASPFYWSGFIAQGLA